MLRRRSLLALPFLLLSASAVFADERGDWSVVQPTEAVDDLLLLSRPGQAEVRQDGLTRTYRLAPDEQWMSIAGTADGWVAAGRKRHEDGTTQLVVVSSEGGQGFRRLPSAVSGAPRLQVRPQVFVSDGSFEGIAWLEGEGVRELAVRARPWSGGNWGAPVTVSRAGRGSQTGLSATQLSDGSTLLVWAAFDGTDDEIHYSTGRGSNWDQPRRLGPPNRVPDVMPSVISTRRGALAAWSRLVDGEYRLMVSRLKRGRWQSPEAIGTGLFPGFVRLDHRTHLLHRTAEPRGWQVVELKATGQTVRRAHFLATAPARPQLELRDASGIDLSWPSRRAARGYWDVP